MNEKVKKQKQKSKKVNGKNKGATFERKVAELLTEWWGVEFHRTPQSGGLHWSLDNRVSGDIVPPVDSKFPFSIECKKHEGWMMDDLIKGTGKIVGWWVQCSKDSNEVSKIPLLVFSRNNQPIYFMMKNSDFSKLVENGYFFTNYLLTTLSINKDIERVCVGIGLFDELLKLDKEKIIELFVTE